MKTAAIITRFGNSNWNFGAQLQAFALQKVVEGLGFKCLCVDVDVDTLVRSSHPYFVVALLRAARGCFKAIKRLKNRRELRITEKNHALMTDKFERFQSTIPHTEKCDSYSVGKKFGGAFDYYITGSDQVWTVDSLRYTPTYFLDFAQRDKKRISYAASIARDRIPWHIKRYFKKALGGFSNISVRETGAVSLLKDLTEKDAKCVLDPVLLIPKSELSEIMVTPSVSEPYILTHFTGKVLSEDVHKYAKEHGLKVLSFIRWQCYYTDYEKDIDILIDNAGPAEFMGYIKNARYVVTSSFHATALSCLFHVNVVSVAREGHIKTELSRQGSLLKQLGLQDRFKPHIWQPSQQEFDAPIDWEAVEDRLDKLREESLGFLKEALEIKSNDE